VYIRQGGHHVGHWPTFLVVLFLMLNAGMDTSDPPPPYTAVVDETKVNHVTGQLQGSVSFIPEDRQAHPPGILSVCPSAPPGYETVAYYPALSSADAAVLLQPQHHHQQQQPQVNITIVQQVQRDVQEPNRPKSYSTDVCLSCCLCLCCTCPCVLVSFLWNHVIMNFELLVDETFKVTMPTVTVS